MTQLSNEDIGAYLDGELTTARMTEVEDYLTRSPETLRQMLAIRRTDLAIVSTYDSINDQPLPAGLVEKIKMSGPTEPAAPGQASAAKKQWRFGFRPRLLGGLLARPAFQLPLAASLALAIGIGVGGEWAPSSSERQMASLMVQGAGVVTADSALFAVLENQPSAVPVVLDREAGVRAMPVLTFASKDGAYCRQFEVATPTASSRGVACRGDQKWRIRVMAAAGPDSDPTGAAGTYLPASGADEPVIDRVIGALIDGAPLGQAQERALIDQAWQRD